MKRFLTILAVIAATIPANACDSLCSPVVQYHGVVSLSDGYGNTYDYKKSIWNDCKIHYQECHDALYEAIEDYINHCDNDCTRGCTHTLPALNCLEGQQLNAMIVQIRGEVDDALESLTIAYVAMDDAYDDWTNAFGIVMVVGGRMIDHCDSHPCEPCDETANEPVR